MVLQLASLGNINLSDVSGLQHVGLGRKVMGRSMCGGSFMHRHVYVSACYQLK